jgi:lipopolysaccharide export system permease protein
VKLLDRYVARQFITTFLYLVLGLPLLFIVTDVTDNLDRYLDRGISGGAIALSYLYYIPQFVFWALPIAGLIATVFTIGGMTRHQEIVAAKAGGVSFYRLLAPILLMGAALSVLALGFGELVPVTNTMRAEALGERQMIGPGSRPNFVYQTQDGAVLSVRRLDGSRQQILGLLLERGAEGDRPAMHTVADHAVYERGVGWVLQQGYMRMLPPTGDERTFEFSEMRVPGLTESPEELRGDPKEPEEMRYAELTRYIGAVERSGGDPAELQVERGERVSLPLAILVIILFGGPLSTSSKRGGAAYGIGVSLLITMIYLLLFRVGRALGASGALPPLVAVWMPNLIFLVAGLILLSRVRT